MTEFRSSTAVTPTGTGSLMTSYTPPHRHEP